MAMSRLPAPHKWSWSVSSALSQLPHLCCCGSHNTVAKHGQDLSGWAHHGAHLEGGYGIMQNRTYMQPAIGHGAGARRQLNCAALLAALLVPFGLFAGTFWAMSFELYYRHPHAALLVVALAFLLTLVIGAFSAQAQRNEMMGGQRSWHHFIFLTSLIACCLGSCLGYLNITWNGMRYYDYISLRKAVDVDPGQWQGQQALDVGEIDFKVGSQVDRTKAFLWHKTRTYCAAPIVSGDGAQMANYDFWAVGMDCCSSKPGDFSCGELSMGSLGSNHGLAGLRVIVTDESEIQGYSLAVQQAAAAYNIQSQHPIFLYVMKSPYAKIKAYLNDAHEVALVACVSFLTMQSVLVIAQAYKFGKHSPSGYPA